MTCKASIVKIVFPESSGKYCLTAGTKVLMPDGSAMPGVTGITLHGKVNDVWRATIDCIACADEADGVLAKIRVGNLEMVWWRRWLLRICGVRELESASLEHEDYARWKAVWWFSK